MSLVIWSLVVVSGWSAENRVSVSLLVVVVVVVVVVVKVVALEVVHQEWWTCLEVSCVSK